MRTELDPLATRLAELQRCGSLRAAELSPRMRKRLEPLFRIEALVDVKAGGGRRVELRDAAALANWIRATYPAGLDGVSPRLPARAEAAMNFRDTKRGRPLDVALVHVRGFGHARLVRDGAEHPIATLTATFGAASVVLDPSRPWQFQGRIGVVENLEVFLAVERLEPALDVAVWAAGPLNGLVLDWLASQSGVSVVHFGDYDPIGLSEYLRLRAALGPRATLFVPADFEELLQKYGQRGLLAKSTAVFARVRKDADDAAKAVVAVIERHGLALEQETLLSRNDTPCRTVEP